MPHVSPAPRRSWLDAILWPTREPRRRASWLEEAIDTWDGAVLTVVLHSGVMLVGTVTQLDDGKVYVRGTGWQAIVNPDHVMAMSTDTRAFRSHSGSIAT